MTGAQDHTMARSNDFEFGIYYTLFYSLLSFTVLLCSCPILYPAGSSLFFYSPLCARRLKGEGDLNTASLMVQAEIRQVEIICCISA